ncbi:TPA: LbtU family siderophore porin [Legionella feeleii]|uniref:Coiled-coil protein n=1 Tax=Legionella feeleii TaxID=453 RepID=A0A378IY57_9GAMM|nr:LbtU family siderophore porin [Legionella feeleii]STX39963.1 coiled-coil protein [Legionella feeleii]
MKHKVLIMIALAIFSGSLFAANNEQLQREILRLQRQTQALQTQLNRLQKQLVTQSVNKPAVKKASKPKQAGKTTSSSKPVRARQPVPVKKRVIKRPVEVGRSQSAKPPARHSDEPIKSYHTSALTVHTVDDNRDSSNFYPTALLADGKVITFIAGTPVVTAPYTGDRPAFDGSDYIVNISSINRDIRLMQQRRRLYRAYESIGYPVPNVPIIALSGKAEPVANFNRSYAGNTTGDIDLGSSEFDVAAMLNDKVEAFMSVAYDETPPLVSGPRVSNSAFQLNMGFVNIGDLDQSPYYFTAGQLYVPFGRYSSAMISSPLTLRLTRTKSRPFILGYKSQYDSGPYAAVYGFRSDTTLGKSGVGGVNLGYTIKSGDMAGEIGASYIGSIDDSAGMQDTGSSPGTTFGGFSSITNGNERVGKVPGLGVHWNMNIDRYNFTAEWVGATKAFRTQDLSFNGRGAKPQAIQLEAGVTFMSFCKPSSFSVGYQWTKDSLALNLPKRRLAGVYSISIWKDTVESLEYRHDNDYRINQFANGASPPNVVNQNTIGTGRSSDTILAQIGVYF